MSPLFSFNFIKFFIKFSLIKKNKISETFSDLLTVEST